MDRHNLEVIFRVKFRDSGGEPIIMYPEEVKESLETCFPGMVIQVEVVEELSATTPLAQSIPQ